MYTFYSDFLHYFLSLKLTFSCFFLNNIIPLRRIFLLTKAIHKISAKMDSIKIAHHYITRLTSGINSTVSNEIVGIEG